MTVDEYWELLSSLQSYSQRRITHTEALHRVHHSGYTVDESITQLRLLAGFPDAAAEADDSDHVALTDPACTVCGDGGNVFLCDAAGCRRVYHAACLQLDGVPDKYECPSHFCRRCQARVVDPCQSCRSCPSAFCDLHIREQRQHHYGQTTHQRCPAAAILLLSALWCLSRLCRFGCVCWTWQSKWRSWVERRRCLTSSPTPQLHSHILACVPLCRCRSHGCCVRCTCCIRCERCYTLERPERNESAKPFSTACGSEVALPGSILTASSLVHCLSCLCILSVIVLLFWLFSRPCWKVSCQSICSRFYGLWPSEVAWMH